MKEITLSNGIKVVLVPLTGLRGVTVEAMMKIGAQYEIKGEYGISHFLEHMAFKGTNKRPSPTAVFNEIDQKGASGNAETGLEMTSYYITTVNENLEWAIELLADAVTDPLIDEKELDKEKGVIIEEIKMYNDNPMMGLSSQFLEQLWGESKVGCWSVSGKESDIAILNRDSLIKYRNKYFDPRKTVIVVSGNVGDENRVEEWLERYWGRYTNQASQMLPVVDLVWSQARTVELKKGEIEQGHFCLGLPGISRGDKRRPQMRMLGIMLSGNTSSKLFEEIRSKRGWAYYVYSVSDSLDAGGLLGIQSGVKLERMDDAIALAKEIMLGVTKSMTSEDLANAKSYLKGKIELAMDQSEFWSGYVGEKILLENRLVDVKDELMKYEAVSEAEIRELATDLIRAEEFRVLKISRA